MSKYSCNIIHFLNKNFTKESVKKIVSPKIANARADWYTRIPMMLYEMNHNYKQSQQSF